MNRSDIESVYRVLLGREVNAEERSRMTEDYLSSVKNLPLDTYVEQTLRSNEFLARWKHAILSALIPNQLVVTKRLSNGLEMLVDLRQVYVGWGILNEVYEPDEVNFVKRFLRSGCGFVDIGANIGYYSIIAASIVGTGGFVHAFEPTATSHDLLQSTVERNSLQAIVKVHKKALSSTHGTVVMVHDLNSVNMGGAHVEAETASTGEQSSVVRESVECATLDSFDFGRRVDLIKIDVEGAEKFVLQGGVGLLERDHPAVMIELNEHQLNKVSQCTSMDVVEFFSSRGYVVNALRDGGELMPIDMPVDVIHRLQGEKGNTNVVMLPRSTR